MDGGSPEGAERERLEFVSGLRALAVLGVLTYEVFRHAPRFALTHALAQRAFFSTWHGFELLLLLSGFGLAAPVLAARRRDGFALWSLTRFALGRSLRIAPAFLVTFALLVFAQHGLSDDGFTALAVQLRATALFPALLALYLFAPFIFGVIAASAVAAGLFTVGHVFDVGALLPFMLGIALADVWARRLPLARFGWLALVAAVAAAAGGLLTDPLLGGLPGPLSGSAFGLWNPLWSLALGALLVAFMSRPQLARLGALPGVLHLAVVSYAIVLVAQPLATLAFWRFAHQFGNWSIGLAFVSVLTGAAFLWFAFDRYFSGARHAALVAVLAERLPAAQIRFGKPASGAARDAGASVTVRASRPLVTRQVPAAAKLVPPAAAPERAFGPLPTMHPGMLATIIARVGSNNDLRAEVEAAKARIAASRHARYDDVAFEPAPPPAPVRFYDPATAPPPHKIVSVAFVAPRPVRAAKVRMHFGPTSRGARAS